MNLQQTESVLNFLAACYPNIATPDEEWRKRQVKAWAIVFSGTAPKAVMDAARRFVDADTKGFYPTPGQIRALIDKAGNALNSVSELDPGVVSSIAAWLALECGTTDILRERSIPERYIVAAAAAAEKRKTAVPTAAIVRQALKGKSMPDGAASPQLRAPLPTPDVTPTTKAPPAPYEPPDAEEWERLRKVQIDKLRAAGIIATSPAKEVITHGA
jgi:hypothetical protein